MYNVVVVVIQPGGGEYADTTKLTNAAKLIMKTARQEVAEIEACPDCYARARNLPRANPSWFIEACRQPHPLVWAKLKGFPFWPAKAFPRLNGQGFVDVRFFGEHDRSWVKPKDVYLYSREPPAIVPRKKKLGMTDCLKEIARHIKKLELAFGPFKFAPPRVQYDYYDPMQIKIMLPKYDPQYLIDPMTKKTSTIVQPMEQQKIDTSTRVSSINLYETILSDFDSDVDVMDDDNESQKSAKINSTQKLDKQLKKIQRNIIENKEEHLKNKTTINKKDKNILTYSQKNLRRSKSKPRILASPEKNRTERTQSPGIILQKIQTKEPKIVNNTLNTDINEQSANTDTDKSTKAKRNAIDSVDDDEYVSDIITSKSSNTKAPLSISINSSPKDLKIMDERSILKSSSSTAKLIRLDTTQELKETIMDHQSSAAIGKRHSKAKKSFPNRPPRDPPIILRKPSSITTNLDTTVTTTSMVKKIDVNYQLPPPEAGPLSAQLNQGAHELARQMAELMEKAVKDASKSKLNNTGESVDPHSATVYALRLQIERIKWEHQQQLAELKHNAGML